MTLYEYVQTLSVAPDKFIPLHNDIVQIVGDVQSKTGLVKPSIQSGTDGYNTIVAMLINSYGYSEINAKVVASKLATYDGTVTIIVQKDGKEIATIVIEIPD